MEERQMLSQIVKNLQLASPVDIEKYTGIRNWESKSRSYTKSLTKVLLPHDSDSVYCMDKLHLCFRSNHKKKSLDYRKLFVSKRQFDVNDWITLIPDSRKQSSYYYSFNAVVEDNHLGKVNLFNTRNQKICMMEIDNEVLYCQSSLWIIAAIYVVAEALNLQFNNISVVEIARDSNENIYQHLTEIYYQSVVCSGTIHRLYGDHKYYKPVTKCKYEDSPDEDDPNTGLFRIGKSKSNTYFKAYNKTKEINDKRMKKHYIHSYHNLHLDQNRDVYRMEMTATSGSFANGGIFGKKDVDLLYFLDKYNLPVLFFALLGDRLVFKDLRTKHWINGNDVYDTVRIISPPTYIRTKEIPVKPLLKKFSHDRNINRTRHMINQYLDDDIGFISLVDFCKRGMKEDLNFAMEFRSAYNTVLDNHRNKISKRDHLKLEKLCRTLRKGMNSKKGIGLRMFMVFLL